MKNKHIKRLANGALFMFTFVLAIVILAGVIFLLAFYPIVFIPICLLIFMYIIGWTNEKDEI